jgi:hypothetical protein
LLRSAAAEVFADRDGVETPQNPESPPESWAKALAFATSSLVRDGIQLSSVTLLPGGACNDMDDGTKASEGRNRIEKR